MNWKDADRAMLEFCVLLLFCELCSVAMMVLAAVEIDPIWLAVLPLAVALASVVLFAVRWKVWED